ncbi:hypothetical protein BLNAU_11261 [Blattamonas nauphoetae]|uniref:Uncharacterized protein n=1 Tax=Blattamonas nauphoetae TaxID=2049346 RepID=A0ABQ9XPP2_9EUKA|nr:hypothetical protein BLNAU_11261 [Blattamonas nauphoetae]
MTSFPFDPSFLPSDPALIFLSINPETVDWDKNQTPIFQSILKYLEFNCPDGRTLTKISSILSALHSHINQTDDPKPITFDHLTLTVEGVDTFVTVILSLLATGNVDVRLVVFLFLEHTIYEAIRSLRLSFVETGFFTRLSTAIQQQDIRCDADFGRCLVSIVSDCLQPANFHFYLKRSHEETYLLPTIHQTIFDEVVKPMSGFVESVCQHRYDFDDTLISTGCLSTLFRTLIHLSPLYTPTMDFVVSSSIILAFTSCVVFFEDDDFVASFYRDLDFWMHRWKRNGDDSVRRRGREVLNRLKEEGISDELELHYRMRDDPPWNKYKPIAFASRTIDELGGNMDYW